MACEGDGIYRRGMAWWLEFRHQRRRYQFALGRWKEPKMIRRYVHLSQAHLREAVEKLAENSPQFSLHLSGEPNRA